MQKGMGLIDYRPPRPEEKLSEPARWIWLDHHDFYGIFWASAVAAIAGIEELLWQSESDLGQSLIAMHGEQIVGVMCFFSLDELPNRSLVSLRFMLTQAAHRDEARNKGRQFARQVPKLAGSGLYLARIAVAEPAQGMGVGSGFLHQLEEQAKARGLIRLCLHVHRDNSTARHFYEKQGFVECAGQCLAYLGMEKRLDKSASTA